MADENFEDDIFDDLYDEEPAKPSPAPAASAPASQIVPEPAQAEPVAAAVQPKLESSADTPAQSWQGQSGGGDDTNMDHSGYNAGGDQSFDNGPADDDNYGPINVKEDG